MGGCKRTERCEIKDETSETGKGEKRDAEGKNSGKSLFERSMDSETRGGNEEEEKHDSAASYLRRKCFSWRRVMGVIKKMSSWLKHMH